MYGKKSAVYRVFFGRCVQGRYETVNNVNLKYNKIVNILVPMRMEHRGYQNWQINDDIIKCMLTKMEII